MIRRALTLILALAALPAMAQERIAPEAFLDLAEGRTLTFELFGTGQIVGVEEFLSRSRSVWREEGGACTYGVITVEEGKLCFLYNDRTDLGPSCWFPFRAGDRLFVRTDDLLGAQIQEITRITDDPVGCPAGPSA